MRIVNPTFGVSATTQCPVDDHLACSWLQKLHRLAEEDGLMRELTH